MGNYAYLWAYDVEAQANKVFRISRIGNVQVTNDPWTAKAKHKRGQADIFHFTGDTPIPVKLELDLLAKNLLVEEYPESAVELKPIGATNGTPDCFLLQTNVYSMLGLGRFYCGLRRPHHHPRRPRPRGVCQGLLYQCLKRPEVMDLSQEKLTIKALKAQKNVEKYFARLAEELFSIRLSVLSRRQS